jgi:acetyltransferase-like isoleucine patch superfamily enzyme
MKRLIKAVIALGYKIKFAGKGHLSAATNIILRNCTFEGKNSLGDHTYLSHTSMAYASYIGFSSEFSNCKIGRYCSIGNHVRVVSATHPTDLVSTYPAFYSDTYRVSYVKKAKYVEHIVTDNGYECEIGNDVWIGDNVLIKGGIKIGDGAVIAMGSVVLHDIPPYTIVAGVPAKEIRKRFDDATIDELEKIKWWNKPTDWIEKHAEEFDNPLKFIELYGIKGGSGR